MSMRQTAWVGLFCSLLVAAQGRGLAITPGFVETFTSGLGGWQKGQVNPSYLSTVPSGGPAGAGDAYLESQADGGGSFGKLTVFNAQQWSTDFVTDGVTSVRMDLLNQGAVPLAIRIGLRSGGSGYISATPFALPAGGGWQAAEFPLSETGMTTVGAPASWSSFMAAGGFQFRILNASSTSDLNGDTVVSTLGVDNITAVPEPTCLVLTAFCAAMSLAGAARWHRGATSGFRADLWDRPLMDGLRTARAAQPAGGPAARRCPATARRRCGA